MILKRILKTLTITILLVASLSFQALSDEKVSIDFDNVDIRVFIKFISEVTNKNFVIDSRVKAKVTVVSPGKISKDKAYKVFESVLDVNGYAAVPAGDVIKIISTFEARTKNMKTVKGKKSGNTEDNIITQVIPLDFADPRSIKRLIAPLVSKRSAVMSYEESKMIIITDYQSNINRLLKIIAAVDILETGREISIIPLQNADADKLSKTLKLVFPNTKKTEDKVTLNNVRFVADERTNTIIAVAGKQDIKKIKDIILYLDKEKPVGDEKFHVYYLENAEAEKLAEVLLKLSDENSTKNSANKKASPLLSEDVNITADKATNALIIKASKNDYEILEKLIVKLDIRRPMVTLDCLIMEINTDYGFEIGAEWAIGYDQEIKGTEGAYGGGFSGNKGKPYSSIGMIAEKGIFPGGFSVGAVAKSIEIGGVKFPNLGALINASQTDKNIQILSKPQVTTLDNEKAKISVGKNIPYLTSSSSGDSQYSNFEYKDVGIVLEITPQISKDGLIKLKIFQETSKLDAGATNTQYTQPTTLKRTIDTTVVVKNKNTIVLGGLIDDSFSENETKVPCLGDIPLLGHLFKLEGETSEKTNLFVFITPHVIEDEIQAKEIYLEHKEYLDKEMKNKKMEMPKDIPLYD